MFFASANFVFSTNIARSEEASKDFVFYPQASRPPRCAPGLDRMLEYYPARCSISTGSDANPFELVLSRHRWFDALPLEVKNRSVVRTK